MTPKSPLDSKGKIFSNSADQVSSDYIKTNLYTLKARFGIFLTILETGQAKAIILTRRNRTVAALIPLVKPEDNGDQHLQAPRGS